MSLGSENSSGKQPAGQWADIFTGRTGVYTATLSLGVTLFAIDTFVIVTLLPTIVADIGGMRFYTWSFALFSVGAIIGGASSGPMIETVGRRAAYAGAGVVFLIGVLGVSLSPNMLTLVLWRLVEGIGGGAIAAQAYGLVGVFYPPHLRSRILTVVSTLWGFATLLGPGFGGIFAELNLWRGAFWGTSLFTLIFIYLAWRYVPESEKSARLSDIPYKRLVLLATSVLLLSLTSQFESNLLRIILIVLSIAVATWAFRSESGSENKMYPRGVLALNTGVGATYWVIVLTTVIMTFVNVYATLYLQVLHGITPLIAAYIFSVMSLFWTLAALVVAPWQGKAEVAAIPIGIVLMAIGTAGLTLFVVPGPVWLIAVMLAVVGTGMGFSNNPLIQRAIAAVPADEKSIAGISVQSMRTLGISFGAATAGLIAAAAGLTHAAEPETVARAVKWVHGANIVVALFAIAAVVPMITRARPTASEAAE